MARGARGVTCRTCGCLNFSSEHEECDKCRSKTRAKTNASANRLREDAASSNGKKRRHEAIKNTSNKKQPDVIDLISEDDEDSVVVQKASNRSVNSQRELFQSRVFGTVAFNESDFPSLEQGAVMRRQAGSTSAVKINKVVTSQVQVTRLKLVDIKPRPPPSDKQEKTTQKTEKGEAAGTKATTNSTASTDVKVKKAVQPVTNAVQVKSRGEEEDPFFQSRVFDSVAFQALDFVTVFDGLAVARRSQPLAPKSGNSVASATSTTSTSVGPVAPTTVSAANEVTGLKAPSKAPPDTTKKSASEAKPTAKAATTPVKSTAEPTVSTPKTVSATAAAAMPKTVAAPTVSAPKTVASTAAAAAPQTVAATAAAPLKTVTATPPTSAAAPKPAKSLALPPSANPPRPASKPTLVSSAVGVAPPPVPKPKPVQVTPTFSKPPTQGSSTSMPATNTKVAAVAKAGIPSRPTSVPAPTMVGQSTATLPRIPSTFLPVPATVASRPAPAAIMTRSLSNTTAIPKRTADVVNAAATKVYSATNRNGEITKTDAYANLLLPKKRHPEGTKRTDEAQQRKKPSPIVIDSTDGDAVLFVKVNAAPLEMTPVEPPVLGYCSPDFLAFMRECGDEDADEDDDPEEVSRSQLKLLDVVDLTNLSDSESSDAESPMPTPRGSVTSTTTLQQDLPANTRTKDTSLPVAIPTTTVAGNRTWYVPTLDSERTRTRPEKVMCELCEETGLPSRLVRCPTCTKYYHKKCARENGDENVCWNCELGSMIDDTELDEEHAKHNSEYLAYLRAIRRSASPDSGEGVGEEEEEQEDEDENQDGEDEDAAGDGDVEMTSPAEGGEDNPFSEAKSVKSAGKIWKEFIGGATADVEDSFHEITNRIAEELRDEDTKQIYSRGFVSRDEFEAQMAEVEEYYISEEARLQQLEREKVLEGRKAAEARRAQAAAEQAAVDSAPSGEQPADGGANDSKPPSVPTNGVHSVANLAAGIVTTSAPPISAAATTQSVAVRSNTQTATTAPAAATTAPSAAPVPPHPADPRWPQFYETFSSSFKPAAPTAAPAAKP